MTYVNAFSPNFFLPLRERRATYLDHMKDATLEVESNILVVEKLRGKVDRDMGRGKFETSTSSSSIAPPQID